MSKFLVQALLISHRRGYIINRAKLVSAKMQQGYRNTCFSDIMCLEESHAFNVFYILCLKVPTMLAFIRKTVKYYKVAIILVDLALINVAYLLAFLVRYNWTLPAFNFEPYVSAAPFITIAALIYFDMFGLLKFYRKSMQEVAAALLKSIFILSLTTIAITYFMRGFSFPRLILIIAPAFQFVLLLIWKGVVLHVSKRFASDLNLMVIGARSELSVILDKVEHTLKGFGMHIKCIIPSDEMGKAFKRLKDVQEVFISDNVSEDDKMKIITECLTQKKIVYIVPHLLEISLSNARMVQFEDMPAFMIDRLGLTVEQRFFKRVFDICVSFFGIIAVTYGMHGKIYFKGSGHLQADSADCRE